jgi:hypothetical protein
LKLPQALPRREIGADTGLMSILQRKGMPDFVRKRAKTGDVLQKKYYSLRSKKKSESEFYKHTLELFYFINLHSSSSQPGHQDQDQACESTALPSSAWIEL